MAFENLFKPIKLGPVEIKNRIAFSPAGEMYADAGGFVTEQTLAFQAARAKGGAGLIITGTVQTNQVGFDTSYVLPGHLSLHTNRHIMGMIELVDRVHAFDAKIFVQLSPGFGRNGISWLTGVQPWSCSAIPYKVLSTLKTTKNTLGNLSEMPREMTIEEIVDTENKMADAAQRAKIAGFDGIELHGHCGYLLQSFLSPRSNMRTDLYGGSLENRLRFAINIIKKVRAKIGNDLALGMRLPGDENIPADDHGPAGLTLEDNKVIAKKLEEAGLDYIDISGGATETIDHVIPRQEGEYIPYAVGFKEAGVKIPLVVPSIHDLDNAERAIKEGKIDMLGSARPLLVDPEWPNKAKEGRVNEIRRCKKDDLCLTTYWAGGRIAYFRCFWNPESGRERYNPAYFQPPRPLGKFS